MIRLRAPSESPDPLGKPLGLGASVYLRGGWWLWSVTCLGARTQLTSICAIPQEAPLKAGAQQTMLGQTMLGLMLAQPCSATPKGCAGKEI